MLILIPILSILCVPALWFLIGRPRFLLGMGKAVPKKISIIIPARDEEHNIKNLLESINLQTLPAHETVVVNDDSSDQTAHVAQELGAKVIDSKPLPADWKGKPWACQQGAEATTGDWLLFLDADTRLMPHAIAQLSNLTEKKDHAFSICPWHTVERPYEQLSVFFNILMVIGMKAFTPNKDIQDDTRLVGQCMLISRANYAQCSGHAAVKSEILENYHLSEVLKSMGIKRSCYLGKHSITMRMFPEGFTELWRSWKKGFISGAAEVPRAIMIWTSIWINGMIMAIIALIVSLGAGEPPFVMAMSISAYLIHALLGLWVFKLVGRFSVINALLFPIALIFYHVLFFAAVINAKRGRATQWKGRDVS